MSAVLSLVWMDKKRGPQNDARHAIKHFLGRAQENWRDLLSPADQARWDTWHRELRACGCDTEDHTGRCPNYAICRDLGTQAAPLYTQTGDASFQRAVHAGLFIAFHYSRTNHPVINTVDGTGIFAGAFARYAGPAHRGQVDTNTLYAATLWRPPAQPRASAAIQRLPAPRRQRAATWQHTRDALEELLYFAVNRRCLPSLPHASRNDLKGLLRWWGVVQDPYVLGRALPPAPHAIAHLAAALKADDVVGLAGASP